MKNFKKIASIIMATFAVINCVGCSNFSGNDTKETYGENVTTDVITTTTANTDTTITTQETVVICAHSNGGDAVSRIIDDKHHENGIICFDCNEVVWSEIHEGHDLSNRSGSCVCGYQCEHGYGDDYYYEIAEDSHTAVFVCDVCHSVIYEETNEHFFREGTCVHCGYNENDQVIDKSISFCGCEVYGDTVFQGLDDEKHQVGVYCATCDLTKWESTECHFYYNGVCQLSMCKHTCEHSKMVEGECVYCGYQPSTGAYNQ